MTVESSTQKKVSENELRHALNRVRTPVRDRGPQGRWLNLACGNRSIDGFHNVDKVAVPGVDQAVDLFALPWPWPDRTWTFVYVSNFLEHIPHQVNGHDSDFIVTFLEELFRVMDDGALLEVHIPHWKDPLALSAPGHVRVVNRWTFHPWEVEDVHSAENSVRMSGTRLELVDEHVVRKFGLGLGSDREIGNGALTDWHTRRYLGLEIGHPHQWIAIFRVRKSRLPRR